MNITNVLTSPFSWLLNLFSPKTSLEVENAIEQLEWNPTNFEMLVERNADSRLLTVQIKSIETLWSFPDDEPMSVCICLRPDNCWLELEDGKHVKLSRGDKKLLIEAVNAWIVEYA